MLRRESTTSWGLQDIARIRNYLHTLYSRHQKNTGHRSDKLLPLFSKNLNKYNAYRNFAICGNSSATCETLELSSVDNDHTVLAQLGASLEIGYSQDLGMGEMPVINIKNMNRIRWNIVQPLFDELLLLWGHLDVSVIDISGGFSYVCTACFFTYNTSCSVFETDHKYGILMQRALAAFPLSGYHRPVAYHDMLLTPEQPFEADIITLLGDSLWLHYCAEGNLGHVIKKFATRAREVLIIEWVDPSDEMIVQLKREFPLCLDPTSEESSSASAHSPYTLVEFKRALKTDFCGLTSFIIGDVSESRYISMNMHVFNKTFYDDLGLTKADSIAPKGHAKRNNSQVVAKYERLRNWYERLVVFA
jgi:hypothetical protein